MERAAGFVRRLRSHVGEDLAYAIVPEFHKDDHVHLHLLIGRAVDEAVLADLWGFGWIDAGKARANGGRAAARKAAAYASKYVAKTFEVEGVSGRHRYEVAQGFQPEVVKRRGYGTRWGEVGQLCDLYALRVVFAVDSSDLEDHDGPGFVWVAVEPAS